MRKRKGRGGGKLHTPSLQSLKDKKKRFGLAEDKAKSSTWTLTWLAWLSLLGLGVEETLERKKPFLLPLCLCACVRYLCQLDEERHANCATRIGLIEKKIGLTIGKCFLPSLFRLRPPRKPQEIKSRLSYCYFSPFLS